jgi:hypothetical protein
MSWIEYGSGTPPVPTGALIRSGRYFEIPGREPPRERSFERS